MRLFVPAVLVCAASAAHASFELALVADNANSEIDRYDPQTGVYLGSFGRGYMGQCYGMAVNQTTGLVYAGNYGHGAIDVFNYSTGEYQGSLNCATTPYFVSLDSTGNIAAADFANTTIRYISPTGTQLGAANVSTRYMEGIASTSGRMWMTDLSSNDVRLAVSTNQGTTYTTAFTSSFSSISLVPSCLSSRGTQLAMSERGTVSGVARVWSFTTSGGTVTGETSTTINFGSGAGITDTEIGHGGVVYFVSDTSTAGQMMRWNPVTNSRGSFVLTNTPETGGMALVVAPEPTSMCALALGVGVLARRRRR